MPRKQANPTLVVSEDTEAAGSADVQPDPQPPAESVDTPAEDEGTDEQGSASDVQADGEGAVIESENENRSEQVMVIETTDEPVRCGGHILTDHGWVLEDSADENQE